jgi:type I restriction-modification system DNA methylase subunit
MELGQRNWITNFIWGIADDVLRDLYVRGKYRDVILPMTVLRRLDAELESTKQAVLDMKAALDTAEVSCRNTVPPASPQASSAGLTCAPSPRQQKEPRGAVTKHIEVQSEL